MHILGISCYFHDAASSLIKDGVVVAAAEEERFSRVKHDCRFPLRAIDFCLRQAGIRKEDLAYVVFYEEPWVKRNRSLKTFLRYFPKTLKVLPHVASRWIEEQYRIQKRLSRHFGLPNSKILFVPHHHSHAASAFFCSPFEEAALLTVDGVGEWTTAALGRAKAGKSGDDFFFHFEEEIRFPHSLGLFYSTFTSFLGFEVNEGEYKVMGMAPYGKPNYMDALGKLVHLDADGSFHLNLEYFDFHHSVQRMYSDKFLKLFGLPRPKTEELMDPHYADIAASVQKMTEEILLRLVRKVHDRTGLKKLCMAGGVALNSVANGRILRETPFEELFIQPAAGDSGGSLGAALYAYHVLLGKPRGFVMEHAYWGEAYSSEKIAHWLNEKGIPFKTFEDGDQLTSCVAEELTKGKVVGWFQGRFEWGPRALGNRSILADPRCAEMKEVVNTKIKFREPFRPFAPVIPEEEVSRYFESTKASLSYPARFMLLVEPFRESKGLEVAAVNHYGTGRLQTVRREWNPAYYDVVKKFGDSTGVPVLLNTSFNLRGEPMVASPSDAWNTFTKSGLDLLVLENHLVSKELLT